MADLWVKKSIEQLRTEAAESEHGLRKALGPIALISLGIGAIVGAGIFVLSGVAVQYTGPALVLSVLLSGVGCAFAGLCYAEFASTIPIAGSAYTYSYAAIGEFLAWIIGWDLILEYAVGATTVSIGWSGYMLSFLRTLHIPFPAELARSPWDPARMEDGTLVHSYFNLPAFLVVAVIAVLLILGIRESAKFNNIIVLVKVGVIIMFIAVGVLYVIRANWVPFLPANRGTFGDFGWSGVLRGSGIIFFAYIGFDAVSTAAQEARNPERDMPIGILGSLAISTVLYVAVVLVLTGITPFRRLNVPDPLAVAIDSTPAHWLAPIVKLGAILGTTAVILVMLLGQTRIFYTMAFDGLLPKGFSSIHPRFRTPYKSTALVGFFVALGGGLIPLRIVGELVSIGTLLAFTIVCGSVMVMRKKRPEIRRPFRTPMVWVVAPLGMIVCLAQMFGLPSDTWIRLFGWMAIGLIIYFSYSRHHSVLRNPPKPPRSAPTPTARIES
ncbi:MAG: amino acid permease [Acidobacteria bacterium]|nr:amino acid permease [Acidobacteriota bacterium]